MKHLSLLRRLGMMWKAMRDPRTPLPAKLIAILGLVYAVSPVDLIPDLLPVLGWTDDLGVIVAAVAAFLRIASRVMERMDKEERDRGVIDIDATESRRARG